MPYLSRTLSLVALLVTGLNAAETAGPSADSADKDFVIYFGLDVAVDVRGEKCPVIAAHEREVRAVKDGDVVAMPVINSEFTTKREPMVGRSAGSIENLRGDRTYSPATDPARAALEQQMTMQIAQDQVRQAREIAAGEAARTASATEQASKAPMSPVSQADVQAAKQAAETAARNLNDVYVSPPFEPATPGAIDDRGTYDAYEVRFRISTPEPCENAYGLLRLMVRHPDNPKEVQQALQFFKLRKLGPAPRNVVVTKYGLPPGFAVDEHEVHIYADGREIPTNLSSNRVNVTEAEARQFMILRHMQENRYATVPAQVIRELLPVDFATMKAEAQTSTVVDLAIDREGTVTEIRPSLGQVAPLEADVAAAVKRVRFLPALLQGNPVDSTGSFALSEFVN